MTTRKPNIPTVFIIFGATGDLTSRKILPALFELFEKKKLPSMFKIVGFARRTLEDAEFRAIVSKSLAAHKIDVDSDNTKHFLRHISYQRGDFTTAAGYEALSQDLGRVDGEWKVCSNKLFYLAVPPQHYRTIFENLHSTGLTLPCSPEEGWTRVLVEKPFGRDLQTSHELDTLLGTLFKEEQIYRIDHYLAKEMLQNILTFRFGNNLFEKGWGAKSIEKVEIRLYETLGVETRPELYDDIGTLRDVGQNHLLQMLALVAMEKPKKFEASEIRTKRADVMEAVHAPTSSEISSHIFRAQYAGYSDITGVKQATKTETYFKMKVTLENECWRGVPFYLEAGKRMPEAKKEIVITFKKPVPPLHTPLSDVTQNTISFQIEPKEGIDVQFFAKEPGFDYTVKPTHFTFHTHESERLINEYEKLLLDAIMGDQTLFVSTPEIRSMWRVIDPFVMAFEKNLIPLHTYDALSPQIIEQATKYFAADESTVRRPIGMVGLGKMGANLARQLTGKGWTVIGHNRTAEVTKKLEQEGIHGAYSLTELVQKIPAPRTIWLMLPAGTPTDDALFGDRGLESLLEPGDIVIDGSNAFYLDSQKRGNRLAGKKIHYIDVGVSGGPNGALHGACLMVGGSDESFQKVLPLLNAVSSQGAVAHFPGLGAGHFVKMVHNGIEYGMMQAIAEGFGVLQKAPYQISLHTAAEIYQKRSVIESRLVGWMQKAFEQHGEELESITSTVAHTGEGLWTVETAAKLGVTVPVIADSLKFRQESARNPSFIGKVLSALRGQFGGHATK